MALGGGRKTSSMGGIMGALEAAVAAGSTRKKSFNKFQT